MTFAGIVATVAAVFAALLTFVPAVRGRRPGEELLVGAPCLGMAGWVAAGTGASAAWVWALYLGLFAVSLFAGVVHAAVMWPSYWLASVLAVAVSLAGVAAVLIGLG